MKTIVVLCCAALAVVACSGANPQSVTDPVPETNTHPNPNKPDASIDSSTACVPESNAEFCVRTESNCNVFGVADNCGVVRQVVNCGMCANQSGCVNGKCSGCEPETDTAFCSRLDKACGGAVATDHCGAMKTVANCGSCKASEFCNDGVCTAFPCVPATDKALCTTLNETCGPTSTADNCGTVRSFNCGTCGKGFSCTDHNCIVSCVPETNTAFCSRIVSNCGTATAADNCGVARTVPSCGTLTFNGISGMSMAGGVPAEMAGGGTKYIEAWINPSSATASIVQMGAVPGGVGTTFSLSLIGGKLAIDGMTDSPTPPVTTIAIPLNTWTFVYAGVSGGTGYLGKIVNNIHTEQIMKTDIGSTALIAGDTVVIGSSFVGQMNQIRLWSKVPNTANYHDCMPGEAGLIRQWCFREGSGVTASDSLSGVPTTLNGASWTTGICN